MPDVDEATARGACIQAAAVASLEAKGELDVRVKQLVAERARVAEGLREAGWQIALAGPTTAIPSAWSQLRTHQMAVRQ